MSDNDAGNSSTRIAQGLRLIVFPGGSKYSSAVLDQTIPVLLTRLRSGKRSWCLYRTTSATVSRRPQLGCRRPHTPKHSSSQTTRSALRYEKATRSLLGFAMRRSSINLPMLLVRPVAVSPIPLPQSLHPGPDANPGHAQWLLDLATSHPRLSQAPSVCCQRIRRRRSVRRSV